MKVSELITMLSTANPDAVIVVPASDHSYAKVRAIPSTAIKSSYGLSEDFDEKLERGETRIDVVVFEYA